MPANPFSYWGWRLTLAFSEHSRRHLFTPDSLCWLESCVQTVYLYMPCLKMSKLYSTSEGKQQENQVVRYLRLRYVLPRQINIQQMMQSKALNSAIRKCSLTLLHCLAYVFSVPLSQSALLILRSYLALIQYRQNFWDNIYLCVRYLLSRNMREDLKRSLSDDKVSLSAHLSILPETPLLIWLVKVADSLFALEMRCKYGRAWTGVHWGQQGPDLIIFNRLWIRPSVTVCMRAGVSRLRRDVVYVAGSLQRKDGALLGVENGIVTVEWMNCTVSLL